MRQQIIKAMEQYVEDNAAATFEKNVFANEMDTLEQTVVGVYLPDSTEIGPMMYYVSCKVLGSIPAADNIADVYKLLQYKKKQIDPTGVLVYFPMLNYTSAFDKSLNVDRGIPITERDKVFRNALDRYIRRFGEGFPMLEFTGSMSEAIECMNSCVRKGQRYTPPLWDANGNPNPLSAE